MLAVLACAVAIVPAPAVPAANDYDPLPPEWEFDYDETLNKPWKELQATLPPYPREENLVPVQLKPTSGQTLLIDSASLSVAKDRVVRLVYVLRSPGGGQTVLFEGFRCATRSYKSYAYGLPGGALKPFPEVEWRTAPWTDYGYRRELMQSYFCADAYNPYPRATILRRARYFEPGYGP